jgi:uncharacterized membrane protein YhhN
MAIYLYIRESGPSIKALSLKALASVSFVFMGLSGALGKEFNGIYLSLLLGLTLGLVGDILLDLKMMYKQDYSHYLNLGFISFALGHLAYFSAFCCVNRGAFNIIISILVGAIFACLSYLLFKKIKLNTKGFTPQVLGYSSLLAFTVTYGWLTCFNNQAFIITSLGLTFILISDMILAFVYFKEGNENKILVFFNHLIYYLGQIIIALSIFFL